MKLQSFTMEISLKPFKRDDESYERAVCRRLFRHWEPILKDVGRAQVLIWVGDGTEILEYDGNMDRYFDWGMYAGGCNAKRQVWNPKRDPNREGLHTRTYLYMDDPPKVNYTRLARIIRLLREEGSAVLGDKEIRIGATFDPGPEFANSEFKYTRHPELFMSDNYMASFMYSCTRMHADPTPYAGYPDGVPEGTHIGTFLGRQAQHFLTDLGYDYIWFSNGFGFGRDTWSTLGAVFDGERFHHEESPEVRRQVLEFWKLFRAECPDFPIETRGTNMSVGMDYAKDGVPLYDMYHGGFNMLPPPNSPWAALDGDFGLELMGYMTRIADLPEGDRYLFRYYLHDPWWVNSPWYDRYQGQPHDIYMPLSCARIDGEGKIGLPTHLNLLTVDNTFGDMPDSCVNESIPHLLKGMKDAPDAPAPLVWVYPFREYCTAKDPAVMNQMFGGDWFVRGAINLGLPLSMVISTDNFAKVDKTMFGGSVLFTPVPLAGTPFEAEILCYAKAGGKVMFYGPLDRASDAILALCGVSVAKDSVTGELPIEVEGKCRGTFRHADLLCAGAVNTLAKEGTEVLARSGDYALATCRGSVTWVRGTVSSDYVKGNRLLVPHDYKKLFPSETLTLTALARYGWDIRYENVPGQRNPMVILSKNNGALMLSSYLPSTTAKISMKTPLGAPVLMGYETRLEGGYATYYLPKAEHRECRFFVEMADGVVSAKEIPPVSFRYRRRIELSGLEDATVRVFAETYCKDKLNFILNGINDEYFLSDNVESTFVENEQGSYFELHHVTGRLTVSMERPNYVHQPLDDRDKDIRIQGDFVPNYG